LQRQNIFVGDQLLIQVQYNPTRFVSKTSKIANESMSNNSVIHQLRRGIEGPNRTWGCSAVELPVLANRFPWRESTFGVESFHCPNKFAYTISSICHCGSSLQPSLFDQISQRASAAATNIDLFPMEPLLCLPSEQNTTREQNETTLQVISLLSVELSGYLSWLERRVASLSGNKVALNTRPLYNSDPPPYTSSQTVPIPTRFGVENSSPSTSSIDTTRAVPSQALSGGGVAQLLHDGISTQAVTQQRLFIERVLQSTALPTSHQVANMQLGLSSDQLECLLQVFDVAENFLHHLHRMQERVEQVFHNVAQLK
jgi:hypothetical protein